MYVAVNDAFIASIELAANFKQSLMNACDSF